MILILLSWINLYRYEVSDHGVIYRINRFTHTAYVYLPSMDNWGEIPEASRPLKFVPIDEGSSQSGEK